MIGFRFINLLIPGNPGQFAVTGANGPWEFHQEPNFAASETAIRINHLCAETYAGQHQVAQAAGADVCDAVLAELLPNCLGASFATGLSVTTRRSIPSSDVEIVQIGPRFPRERSDAGTGAVVNDVPEFRALVEAFLASYATTGQTERTPLIIHHWLDTLSCWSLEDLYLSASTILQIVVATEARKKGGRQLAFFDGVTDAGARFAIPALSADFKNMRNDLIHDGRLSGAKFRNKTRAECGALASDVLNWIDSYLHAALNLGPVRRTRFDAHSFDGLNAYSL